MLAVLANEMSAIIQFRLAQLLCSISPEKQEAVEVWYFLKCRCNVNM